MSDSTEDLLLQAAWSYHSAVQRRDGIEARLRRGEIDGDLLSRSLMAAETVMAARVALYRMLMSRGWTPPPAVAQDIVFDDNLLHEPADHLS